MHRDSTPDIAEDAIREILAWLHQTEPRRLLLIAPPDSRLHEAVAQIHDGVERLTPEEATPTALAGTSYDLAVVSQTLETLPAKAAGELLSRLRDLHTKRFLALVKIDDGGWTNTDMIAFGLKRCARLENGFALYRFNIHDYKDTPDWLNAKYWAHPERWGKERW